MIQHAAQFTEGTCRFRFSLDMGLSSVCFCRFVLGLVAFVVLGSVSSVLSQEFVWDNISDMTYLVWSGL